MEPVIFPSDHGELLGGELLGGELLGSELLGGELLGGELLVGEYGQRAIPMASPRSCATSRTRAEGAPGPGSPARWVAGAVGRRVPDCP